MPWSFDRARHRILQSLETVPTVQVERFVEDYLPRFEAARRFRATAGLTDSGSPLYDLPPGEAVSVDTVQVYVNALSFDEVRLDRGRETPEGAARALSLLHLLYGACDRVVGEVGAKRVDFHGPRMHAVIVEPSGEQGRAARVARGLELAESMIELAQRANRELTQGRFPLRFRVGIDVGPCVALNSGRKSEREPVFIGSAANHAAKLAEGESEGIFLSPRVRGIFSFVRGAGFLAESVLAADQSELATVRKYSSSNPLAATFGVMTEDATARRMQQWQNEVASHGGATLGPEAFQFHSHQLPLRSIDYSELMPSNSIWMQLVSIFADLDRYTAYVDAAMASGNLGEAVRVLHVLRSEFSEVIQSDFQGRKVRFIGDCVHGLIAAGPGINAQARDSVEAATECAGGLRSSFEVCQSLMPAAAGLGLAIGFELGDTPVSRIGIRGDRSVRVASSTATRSSEQCQRDCRGHQTKIGNGAYEAAGPDVRRLFGLTQIADNLDYDTVTIQRPPAAARSGPAIVTSGASSGFRAYSER